MELRVLQYFLAVAREESISGAAEFLHLSQPTLSRQIKDMEEELGKQLLIRGNRKIALTEEGLLLRKRAEEIVSLVQKTEKEISCCDAVIEGDVYIGAGETENVRVLANAVQCLQTKYPQIHYHISSSDRGDILDQLDKGLIDFGVIVGDTDASKYNYLTLPILEEWGVLMRKDSPLVKKEVILPEDLWDKPLILSRQALNSGLLTTWLKKEATDLNIVATYSLIYNASLLVDEGFGYALGFNRLINTTGDSTLSYRPMQPVLATPVNVVWKKYQIFSKASEKFLRFLRAHLEHDCSYTEDTDEIISKSFL